MELIQRNVRGNPDSRTDLMLTTNAWKRTMNIGTWNIQSVRSKEIELVQEMRKYKISILGVTETKKKGQGIEDLGSHKLLYSGVSRNEQAKGGVGLIVTNESI